MLLAGTSDLLRSRLGLPPAYVRLLGTHGDLALLTVSQKEYAASRMANASSHTHMVSYVACALVLPACSGQRDCSCSSVDLSWEGAV